MNIIKSYPATLSAVETYRLVKDPAIQRMRDWAGQSVELKSWMIYEDTDANGEISRILSLVTTDGDAAATNSPTFIRDFEQIVACFEQTGEQFTGIKVLSGKSKGGRTYITCTLA